LRHEVAREGHRFRIRPIRSEDAAFVLSLRNDPQRARFLGPTSDRVEDQVAWLNTYFDRPDDWYWIVEDGRTGAPEGTIGLYARQGPRAEWGRWILREGSVAAVESALLVYRFAFDELALDEVFCRTIEENLAVVSFHESCGLERGGTLPLADGRLAVEQRLTAARWPVVRAKLDRLASALARRA
jgi:RimJ/RimL family protein N-acetyltransferase